MAKVQQRRLAEFGKTIAAGNKSFAFGADDEAGKLGVALALVAQRIAGWRGVGKREVELVLIAQRIAC